MTLILSMLALSLLVFVHELGHFIAAKCSGIVVEEFGFGFPVPAKDPDPAKRPLTLLLGKRNGTAYTLNLIPFGGFTRMLGEEDPSQPGSFASKGKLVRAAVLMAGPLMNVILAIVLLSLCFALGWPEATEFKNVAIVEVVEKSPAESAGLKGGDIVLRADDQHIESPQNLIDYTHSKLGQEILLVVRRGEDTLEFHVTPRRSPPEGEGPIGVVIRAVPTKMSLRAYPWGEAIVRGFRQTVSTIASTFLIPAMALRGLIPTESVRPVGPVGIIQLAKGAASQVIARGWWFPILNLTATFSVALAISNILPLPAMDGGRLLFVIIEALRGKRVEPKKEGLIHLIGLALLVVLMLIITYHDITSPAPSLDWGSLGF